MDLTESSRFLHQMGMQTKLDVSDANARLHGLIEELIASGVVSMRKLEERTAKARVEERERTAKQAVVTIGSTVDKYALDSATLPQIDCAALIPLCKGRCCKLVFPLSFQDLDEGVVRWEYGAPYQIRHGDDGYCVHSKPEARGCGVYAQRPHICRTYDCRKDARIWTDFDNRIPAPDEATTVVQIRKRSP
ncbi:MAG: YkgJ family cysteine cluster protein [Proteobacteria bacterium]|nr:YkgJ family cysteine cluster protein [Pseudomonadota bacterium]